MAERGSGGGSPEEARRALGEAVRVSLGGGGDVEELREVLAAVTEFVERLRKPIEELLDKALSYIEGGRVGREVAAFYRELREAGVPEELAAELTREYFERRMRAGDVAGLIREFIEKEVIGEEEEEEGEEEGEDGGDGGEE